MESFEAGKVWHLALSDPPNLLKKSSSEFPGAYSANCLPFGLENWSTHLKIWQYENVEQVWKKPPVYYSHEK